MSAGLVGLSAMLVSRCAYVASTSTGASQPLDGVAAPAAGITAAVTSAAAPQARRTAVAFMTSAPLPSLSSPRNRQFDPHGAGPAVPTARVETRRRRSG